MYFRKKDFIEAVKIIFLIVIPHFYIFACSLAYTKLEGIDVPLNETVDGFLRRLHAGRLSSSQDPIQMLKKYEKVKVYEDYWNERNSFNSIPKAFVFTMSAHTTLGNRHMNVQTIEAQIFYIFTVPLGVILYYIMIHNLGKRLVKLVEESTMLVWRREDEDWNDRQRDIFVRLKVFGAMLLYTVFLLFCLSLLSIIQHHHVVTELVYIVDIFLTVSSSENFVLYKLSNDDLNAFITTVSYFVCIIFAYSTSFTIWSLFHAHSCEDIFSFIVGDRMYDYVQSEDVDEKGTSLWTGYGGNEVKPPPLSKMMDMPKQVKWLHNDGEDDSRVLKSVKDDKSDIFHNVDAVLREENIYQ